MGRYYMFRRAFPWALPVLLALAFVSPTGGNEGPHAPTIERGTYADSVSIAGSPLQSSDQAEGWWGQWNDEEDTPDRIAKTSTIVAWTPVTFSILPCGASDLRPRSHLACTAFPRGPPSA